MSQPPDVHEVVTLPFGVNLRLTIKPLRRGAGDPTFRFVGDAVWRTSRMPAGPVTYRLEQLAPDVVDVRAWGPGSGQLLESVPDLLGGRDDPASFDPQHPVLADAHRRFPGLRVLASGRVMEALLPAVLEQKVVGLDAFAAWRRIVRRLGEPAPDPLGLGLMLMPVPERWAAMPSWEWHRAGVDPQRARTAQACARLAPSIERVAARGDREAVYRGLRSIPGVGAWTAAEVGSRALGDSDAVPLGDYHLPAVVGHGLTGATLPEHEVEAFLEPWRPHRWRVFRLLELSPHAVAPRRGPRMPRVDHRAI